MALAYYELGQLHEAERWATRSEKLGAIDDAATQMLWRQARAKVLARRGEQSTAERLAREAVAIGHETEMLNAQADSYADLGEVLLLGGRPEETAAAFEQAHQRFERKANLVMAGRMRERLAALEAEVG